MIATRFAPSPTGEPHIGNIRTALFAWVFARGNGGSFFVRIEDTDKSREVPGAVLAIVESLEWLGLDYNAVQSSKFKVQSGSSKFKNLIFQSQRLSIYKKYAEELVQSGHAYICVCSEERLQKLRKEQLQRKEPPMYDGHCRSKTADCKPPTANHTVRLKVPKEGVTEFNDLIRGAVRFENKLIDDQVLVKSDGYPTYHLANVVDDYEMGITHVIRGEDWLSSTPKHLLLYQYFGLKPPFFAHLPMILGKDKSKLSKRHGAMPALEYKRAGFLPEAFFNYLAFLGWHPSNDSEIMNRKEIIAQFSLERVQKSAAVFDEEKLTWTNGVYIRKFSTGALFEILREFGAQCDGAAKAVLEQLPEKTRERAIALVQERMRTLKDFAPLARFIVELPDYDPKTLSFKSMDFRSVKHALAALKELMSAIPEREFTRDRMKHYASHLIAQEGISAGAAFHPLRVALSGLKDSPGPFEIAEVLGKTESLRRIKHALQKMP